MFIIHGRAFIVMAGNERIVLYSIGTVLNCAPTRD